MIEKISKISNPLTVIAIFAGIAEISGTVVLPFLTPENQSKFLWFVMAFPSVLVAGFFYILVFRHHVLYAPSDYQSDAGFLRAAKIADNELNEIVTTPDTVEPNTIKF